MLPAAHLRKVVDWARERGAVVASDECYLPLGWDDRAGLGARRRRSAAATTTGVLAVHSLSKRSNLAGYRAGFVAGDPALVAELLEVRKHAGMIVPAPVQAAMVAALGDETHVDAAARAVRARRRDVLRPALGTAGFDDRRTPRPACTCGRTRDEDCWATVDWLAERGILVAPGDFYGPAGDAARPGRADRHRRAGRRGPGPAGAMTDGTTGRYAGVRAAVLGTGLIGGSVLLRLADAGLDVAGWDPDPVTRTERARERGLTAPETVEQAVAGRDVVFLCGPLPTLPRTLAQVAELTAPGCVLTDVGSTKAEVAEAADRLGFTDRFVPGHPMAGAESAGLTAAYTTLLAGAAWVLCPAPAATLAFRWLTGLLVEVFGARVVPMNPASTTRWPRSPRTCRTCWPVRWPGRSSGRRCGTPCWRLPRAASPTAPGSPARRLSGPRTCCSATVTGCCTSWPRCAWSWMSLPPRCGPATPTR